MGFDTKPNFSSNKFEQCTNDIINLSGCTQIYGTFDLESGSTLTICDNVGVGKVLTSNASGIATWQTPSASAASGENVTLEVIQSTHGFVLNNFIGWSGGTYNKAIADGFYDGEFVGIITEVPDVNTFKVTQSGYVTGLTASFAANTTYWLSEGTAGLLTSTEPTGDGEISKSVFIADTTTSGWVLPYAGVVVSTGATSISSADNGLTVSSGIVGLGGTLCQNTEIDVSSYGLSVCNLSGKTSQTNAVFIDDATGTLVTGVTSSGCGDYSSNSPSTCTVGGISSGTVLTGNTLEYLLQEILAPYIDPTFSAFSIATTCPAEVGSDLSGSKTFSWTTTTSGNVATNSIGILDITSGSTLATGLANDSSEALDIGIKTNTSQQTWTWQVTGCSTQGDSFTRNKNVCSIHPYYWGKLTSGGRPGVDNDLVTSGTKVVSNSISTVTVSFSSASNEYTWLAIPATSTSKTCWYVNALDNGLINDSPSDKYPDECVLDITSGQGCWSTVSYKVYMSGAVGEISAAMQFRNS